MCGVGRARREVSPNFSKHSEHAKERKQRTEKDLETIWGEFVLRLEKWNKVMGSGANRKDSKRGEKKAKCEIEIGFVEMGQVYADTGNYIWIHICFVLVVRVGFKQSL